MFLGEVSYKTTGFLSIFMEEIVAQLGLVGSILLAVVLLASLSAVFWTSMRVAAPGFWTHGARSLGMANLFLGLLIAALFAEIAIQFLMVEQPERRATLDLLRFIMRGGLIGILLLVTLLGIHGEGWRRHAGRVTAIVGLAGLIGLGALLGREPLDRLAKAKTAWETPDRHAPWEPEWLISEGALWLYQVRLARKLRNEGLEWQAELAETYRHLVAARASLDTTNAFAVQAYKRLAADYTEELQAYQERMVKSAEVLNLDSERDNAFAVGAAPKAFPFGTED